MPSSKRPAATKRATPSVCVAAVALLACTVEHDSPAPEPERVVAFDGEALAEGNLALACDEAEVEARVDALLAAMTLAQKIHEMHGASIVPEDELYLAGGDAALGIPTFSMVDGPRGVRAGKATAFPVGIARGATFDPALEKRVGAAIALEARARGANVLLAPTINLLRHPAWGRAQETYSEDSMHMGAMAVGFIHGAQNHLIASAKHFAVNSIEDTRFDVDVTIDDRLLREQYLPHFRRAVEEARVGSVMSAYNLVNGSYCAENAPLLTDILKGEWGFRGFVESDWILGTRSTVPSALAGLDIEMPAPQYFGDPLLEAVEGGEVPEAIIDGAVRRILRMKLCFGLDAPEPVALAVIESDEHKALAREVARRSIVLLKNDADALPLERASLGSIAVVGALADVANLGDHGSSEVSPKSAVSPLAGLTASAGDVALVSVPRDTLDDADKAAIAGADAAVVVVGLTWEDEGEAIPLPKSGGDRDSLRLSAAHEQLILDVAAQSDRVIVVLEGGGSLVTRPWIDAVEAAMMAWYPGSEGGHALAELLFGDESPSGRLPATFPRGEEQLPPFDHESVAVTYEGLHGYLRLDAAGEAPEFAFGHGLSYTTFERAALTPAAASLDPASAAAIVCTVDVENTGARAGDDVVQLYVEPPAGSLPRPLRELKAFGRVHLEPGERKRVELSIPIDQLAYYDDSAGLRRVDAGRYTLHVGASASALSLSAEVELTAPLELSP
ncbi:MAG: glycoside hydrolase family 3 C-terminal domain-containing protein [Myxococcales bacterium]|nr:glycoside hydrolase family 3 C-terminal domain-containing protein [Myxococcales bacterium]